MRIRLTTTILPMPGTAQPGEETSDVSLPTIAVPPGYNGAPMDVMALRTTRIDFGHESIAGVTITQQPAHGRAVVNPDHSISLVLSLSEYTGAMSMSVAVVSASGTQGMDLHFDVIPSAQEKGWPTGLGIYMLPVDENGSVEVEPGETHRKVYVTGSEAGLTAADIAPLEGVSEATVTGGWLRDNAPQYGASEELALSIDLGMALWGQLVPRWSQSSNWLLLERGYSYEDSGRIIERGVSGESALHPVYVGAWGEGDLPSLARQQIYQAASRNIVLQDVEFTGGLLVRGLSDERNENILFDGVVSYGHQASITRTDAITFRNTAFLDAWLEEPSDPSSETWQAHADRSQGMFANEVFGLLFDGVLFDHNGWAPDFLPDTSTEGGQPPSMYSHNMYIQSDTVDVTMRNSVSMRAASHAGVFRGGARIEDTLFLDSNIGLHVLGGDYLGAGPVGNYSLIFGNLITQAANREPGLPQIGALDWGLTNDGRLTTLIDSIVAHANDPNDPGDTVLGSLSVRHHNERLPAYDDTIIWRWDNMAVNVDGIDPETLNQSTIQLYTAAVLGVPDATVPDFADYMRGLDPADYAAAVQDVLAFFRAGFGIATPPERTEPATLYFVPDPRADGVRWDNRLNWQLANGDPARPPRNGDTVHLRGALVVSPCDTWTGTIHLEGATLTIVGGRLSGDAVGPGTVQLVRAGQHNLDLSGGAAVDDQR